MKKVEVPGATPPQSGHLTGDPGSMWRPAGDGTALHAGEATFKKLVIHLEVSWCAVTRIVIYFVI